jgi:hypothetical protein
MGMESAFCGVGWWLCLCLIFIFLAKRNGMEYKAGKKRKAERERKKAQDSTGQDMSIRYLRYM